MTLKVDNIQNENASEANVVLNSNGSISIPSQIKHVGDDNTLIEFETDTVKLQTNGSTRVKVDSGGRVGVGVTNPDAFHNSANQLVVGGGSVNSGITVVAGTTAGASQVWFADGTSGDERHRGMVRYEHNNDAMVFKTAGDVERMKLDNAGNVHINNGNLVIGTGGHGIDFSAQTATSATGATTSSELLDHYEEGSWTPNIGGSSSGVSYDIQWGRYTRIGNRVWVEGGLRPTNLNNLTGTANLARIRGLPFNIGNSSSNLTQTGGGAITWYDGSEVSSASHPMLTGGPQTDQILLFQKTSSASANATPIEFFKVGFRLNFYFSYLVTN